MSYESLRQRVLDHAINNHSARVWRVAENIRDHAQRHPSDDRLLHLMSRVGVLCRGLANDLRDGHTTPDQVAMMLDQLADIGELSFEEWLES